MEKALEDRQIKEVPTDYLISLMEIILKYNIFEFHDSYWKQEVGAAMGGRPVPAFSNLFMAEIDAKIKRLAKKYNTKESEAFLLFKRFLDDYISLFVGSSKKLHQLLDEINTINPTIQLTMNHTSLEDEDLEDRCDCERKTSIPFLDTLLTIKDGRIDVDLYCKDTDCNQFAINITIRKI